MDELYFRAIVHNNSFREEALDQIGFDLGVTVCMVALAAEIVFFAFLGYLGLLYKSRKL